MKKWSKVVNLCQNPVCGHWELSDNCQIKSKTKWVFHNIQDLLVDLLRKVSGRRNESSHRFCGPLGYCQCGFPSHLLHKHVHACPSLFPHLHKSQDLPLLISSSVGHDSMHICAKLPDKAFWTNIQENIFLKETINSMNQLITGRVHAFG